jgi:hypothetical protein
MIALAMNVLKTGKAPEAPRATAAAPRPGGAPPPMMPPR